MAFQPTVTTMDDALLSCLRCPIDPARAAALTRDGTSLVCASCRVTFPIKNTIPVLIPADAELPDDVLSIDRLPCVRRAARSG